MIIQQFQQTGEPFLEAVDALPIFSAEDIRGVAQPQPMHDALARAYLIGRGFDQCWIDDVQKANRPAWLASLEITAALAAPQPASNAGSVDRGELILFLQDLASPNLSKEAADRQAARMADALIAKGISGIAYDVLPCDVHLPVNTYIRRGVPVATLMTAIKAREKFPLDATGFPYPAPSDEAFKLQEVLDFLNSIEGAGYGGMASFEIARSSVRDLVGVAISSTPREKYCTSDGRDYCTKATTRPCPRCPAMTSTSRNTPEVE